MMHGGFRGIEIEHKMGLASPWEGHSYWTVGGIFPDLIISRVGVAPSWQSTDVVAEGERHFADRVECWCSHHSRDRREDRRARRKEGRKEGGRAHERENGPRGEAV